ncbi:hypothetical protein HY491_03895 [Candidatus Woesearchaeota archaeon]|nr:hypothetical protein [Candidatus Woesearchaeota archaeon]
MDNLPRFGLCVLHNPVSVHEWDGTQYVLRGGWSLHEGSAIMDKDGTVITQVQPEAPTPDQVMRLGDDEQDPNADARGRAGTRVDLGRDAFYRS